MSGSLLHCNTAYERWLATQCDVVASDLKHKHERMEQDAFVFLRATFFRWAETICDICPECAASPPVLAVGDIHVENYGVWRDGEGRLVWGINDFDEATVMPYALDLVRLTVSAWLSPGMHLSLRRIAEAILLGYERGLLGAHAVVLDQHDVWMRARVMCTAKGRENFWRDLAISKTAANPPDAARAILESAMPEGAKSLRIVRRRKGGGSLGKPRFALISAWQGGEVVREAKALTPSAWNWARGESKAPSRLLELARGPARAFDPFQDARGGYIVRRLAPDSVKIEFEDTMRYRLKSRILAMMGQDLASVHAGAKTAAIRKDLNARSGSWLMNAARRAADAVHKDYETWRHRRRKPASRRSRA